MPPGSIDWENQRPPNASCVACGGGFYHATQHVLCPDCLRRQRIAVEAEWNRTERTRGGSK